VGLPGAYGVAAGELLRVGCGTATKVTIARQVAPSSALSDLESRTDDRASRIAKAVAAAIAYTPDEVELNHGRLNVVISERDVELMKPDPDERWALTRRTWEAARSVLGPAALPETLAFSMRLKSGAGLTLFYYSSHPR
jgi:hypothetical protein